MGLIGVSLNLSISLTLFDECVFDRFRCYHGVKHGQTRAPHLDEPLKLNIFKSKSVNDTMIFTLAAVRPVRLSPSQSQNNRSRPGLSPLTRHPAFLYSFPLSSHQQEIVNANLQKFPESKKGGEVRRSEMKAPRRCLSSSHVQTAWLSPNLCCR